MYCKRVIYIEPHKHACSSSVSFASENEFLTVEKSFGSAFNHAGQTRRGLAPLCLKSCLFFSVDSLCTSVTYSSRSVRRFVCLLLFVFNLYDCDSLFLLMNFVELSVLWVTLFSAAMFRERGYALLLAFKVMHGKVYFEGR